MFEKVGTMARKMWRGAWAVVVFVAGLPMLVMVWLISEDAWWAGLSNAEIQAYLAECRKGS